MAKNARGRSVKMNQVKKINYVFAMDGPQGIIEQNVTEEIYAIGGIQNWYHSVKPIFQESQGKRTLYRVNDENKKSFVMDVP